MAETTDWEFPLQLRPRPEALTFDLETALRSLLLVHAEIPDEAFTASVLGTERIGHGIVIDSSGLILTIGYLIAEASTIWLTTHDGAVLPGHALAYDQVTGFGLVLPLGHLNAPVLPRGSAASTVVGDTLIVTGHGGLAHTLEAKVIARREFAGYWEYVLDDALFTAPAHPQWGGTALLGEDGKLLGVGSLLVQETVNDEPVDANMFVPIDLLEPILDDMVKLGRPARPPRPWLGLYATPLRGHLVVGGLTEDGPAHRAGVRLGDVLVEISGQPILGLAELFRKVWSVGPAGSEVDITVARGSRRSHVRVTSGDRSDYLTKPRHH